MTTYHAPSFNKSLVHLADQHSVESRTVNGTTFYSIPMTCTRLGLNKGYGEMVPVRDWKQAMIVLGY